MAIRKSVTLSSGIEMPAAYHRVQQGTLYFPEHDEDFVVVQIAVWRDAEARQAGLDCIHEATISHRFSYEDLRAATLDHQAAEDPWRAAAYALLSAEGAPLEGGEGV